MWTMPKRDVGFNNPTKSVRFDEDERAKLRVVMRSVLKRNKLADPSKLIKDLMGLTNNFDLTYEERRTLNNDGEDLQVYKPEDTRAPKGRVIADIEEKSGKIDEKGAQQKGDELVIVITTPSIISLIKQQATATGESVTNISEGLIAHGIAASGHKKSARQRKGTQ